MNWLKQQQSVAKQAQATPYTELQPSDLQWTAMESTCVETQVFYLMADSGHIGMAQVIYSNVAGIRTTCQFNTKIFYPASTKTPPLWSSDPLTNHDFTPDKLSFYADACAITLSPSSESYTVKSATNPSSIVNLIITRTAPGFQVGFNGKTLFGTDPSHPWGTMRHAFWPRCSVQGSIITSSHGEIDFKGRGVFIHALQGMKPHHAAAKWTFADFQSPSFSAIMMEYTTPPSYGSTVVNVGGVVREGEIVCAGAEGRKEYLEVEEDRETEWMEPKAARFEWRGRTNGKEVKAVLEGALGERLDKVDVMAKVPGFVKTLVGGVYSPQQKLSLKIKIGDEEEKVEEGELFAEATFIS
ncbi:MAG: hypothetical protein Q9209_004551 [Squamulea sp. 1 TL-2023]